ncbi:MAG: RtcB family protein [Lentisphaeria bacterium]|jgi:tRNA-splicing ligase RtcB
MKWVNNELGPLPVLSWCAVPEEGALRQVANLANHPMLFRQVALMPDCHVGYGMPIGGVIACADAIIPNAVGVDIGCGMGAVQTDCPAAAITPRQVAAILEGVRRGVPLGEGHAHNRPQAWDGLDARAGDWPGGIDRGGWELAYRNLGTLGGGNHFIELQRGDDGLAWLMVHSGSRNLGLRIANHYHRLALRLNEQCRAFIPDKELAYLPVDTAEGQAYIRDMQFALEYARENRRRIMAVFKAAVAHVLRGVQFTREVNIHHNYAAFETHFGRQAWIHRKGATSAQAGETGIIPGSMGTASYIVEGLGNPDSFRSCSHGAGRTMGRLEACRRLSKAECDQAMAGIVFDGWKPAHGRFGRGPARGGGGYDLEEAPQAYKDIEEVLAAELDLVKPLVRLLPLGVLKG